MKNSTKLLTRYGFVALAATFIISAGCNDGDQVTPPTAGAGGRITAGAGGSSSGGKGGRAGAGASDGGAPTEGGTAGIIDEPGLGGQGGEPADCEDPAGCYNCAATTDEQFLNHCTSDKKCPATFDNDSLTKLVNGKLPPLP